MDAPSEPAARIRCGVAGWSYPDWEGCVYPRGLKDKLEYLARFVDMIEINSTFYRPPSTRNAASWLERTSALPGFRFSAKLHQDITHQGALTPGMARAFHEGLAPLVEAGKLSHLLAQFRYDFADTPERRAHLHAIREAFGGIAELVVEVRHASWHEPEALEFLAALGVTVANLDYPLGRDSFRLEACRIGSSGYFRLHGRNRSAWFNKNAGRDETYNYYYSRRELEEIKTRALAIAGDAKMLTLVANNHYRGKEVANALQLKFLITGNRLEVPGGLLAEYPELAHIAS